MTAVNVNILHNSDSYLVKGFSNPEPKPPEATPHTLIQNVLGESNRFSPEQLDWLESALSTHLQKNQSGFYDCAETSAGLHRPLQADLDNSPAWAPKMSSWFSGKTIMLTGSSGFIGKYALEALNQRGVGKVIGVDVRPPNLNIKAANGNFIPLQLDILDKDALREVFETYRPDGVIHLAAKAGVPQAEASDAAAQAYFDVNVKGTDNLAALCKDYEVTFLANAGSSSEFGSQAWDKDHLVPQSEGSALLPEGNYGRTKVFSEMLLSARALAHESADHTLVTTFFNPIGNGERGLLVPLMTRRLLESAAGKGDSFTVYDQYRGYTPIGETLEHLFRAVERQIDAGPNQAVLDYQHCGGGISTNNKVIAKMTVDALTKVCAERGIFSDIDFNDRVVFDDKGARQGDVKATYSDKSKAEKLLGLTPDVESLKNAIENTVREVASDWFNSRAHDLPS